MSFLFSMMLIIIGVMGLIFDKNIFEVLGCFAVAALFDIAGNLSVIARRMMKNE